MRSSLALNFRQVDITPNGLPGLAGGLIINKKPHAYISYFITLIVQQLALSYFIYYILVSRFMLKSDKSKRKIKRSLILSTLLLHILVIVHIDNLFFNVRSCMEKKI